MLLWLYFHTDPCEKNIDKIAPILKNEFGLVSGVSKWDDRSDKEFLVWEDEINFGRYRIHMYDNLYLNRFDKKFDSFSFSYWNQRFTEDIIRRDPMKEIIDRTRGLISGKYIEEILFEKDPDELISMLDDILKQR